MPIGKTALVSDADIETAVALAYRLYPPVPYVRNTSKPHAPGMTLEQIAQELGITREGVRQIEVRAMRKCRQWCEERGLDLWDMLDQIGR